MIEQRSRSPLIPLSFFRRRTPAAANLIGFGLGTMVFGMFFLLSLYMQQVLGFSAMETGVGYLAVALTAVAASGVAQALVTRIQVKPVLAGGMAMLAVGLAVVHAGVGRRLVRDGPAARLLPDRHRARLLVRARLDRGARRDHRQGGRPCLRAHQHEPADRRSVGLAVLATVSTSHTEDLAARGTPTPEALTSGFAAAFWVAVGLAVASFLLTLLALRSRDLKVQEGQAVPVPA